MRKSFRRHLFICSPNSKLDFARNLRKSILELDSDSHKLILFDCRKSVSKTNSYEPKLTELKKLIKKTQRLEIAEKKKKGRFFLGTSLTKIRCIPASRSYKIFDKIDFHSSTDAQLNKKDIDILFNLVNFGITFTIKNKRLFRNFFLRIFPFIIPHDFGLFFLISNASLDDIDNEIRNYKILFSNVFYSDMFVALDTKSSPLGSTLDSRVESALQIIENGFLKTNRITSFVVMNEKYKGKDLKNKTNKIITSN